jgi:hypothetical protein
MLIHSDGRDPVETVRIIDQPLLPLSEDRGVRGVPRHSKTRGSTSNREVIEHERFERPTNPGAGDLCPFWRGLTGVFSPDFPAIRASVTTNPDLELGRAMPEWFMREVPGNRVAGSALGSAPATPWIGFAHSALNDRPVGLEVLSDRFESELVEAAERSQVRGVEGSVGHVEVFRMGSVGTSIIERPRSVSSSPLRAPRLHPQLRRAANTWQPLLQEVVPSHIRPEFAARFLASGALAIIVGWLRSEKPASIDLIADQLVEMLPAWA